jgi:hypothetical protein
VAGSCPSLTHIHARMHAQTSHPSLAPPSLAPPSLALPSLVAGGQEAEAGKATVGGSAGVAATEGRCGQEPEIGAGGVEEAQGHVQEHLGQHF